MRKNGNRRCGIEIAKDAKKRYCPLVIQYRPRFVDTIIEELHADLPALMLVGPRATGKTTTASRHAATVVRLDRHAESAAFRADPDSALRNLAEPLLLDEWQAVPAVLGAVKRAVDSHSRPGRFLLTGSVRAHLEEETWAGTGRVVRLAMYTLNVAEQLGRTPRRTLTERITTPEDLIAAEDTPDLRGYIELALRGGFPEATLDTGDRARPYWLAGYVEEVVTRDALTLAPARDPVRLGRYLEAYALNSAGLAHSKTLYDAAGINRKTAFAYDRLLQNLFIIDELPSWSSNRLKRLARSPKRYLIDPSLLVGILGIDAAAVMRDGDLLGRVLDTFVTSQLRAESILGSGRTGRTRLYHLRHDQGRHEIDLIIELQGQYVIGIEIKATAAPNTHDARHLAWLRDQIGNRFTAGVVLHTGPSTYSLGNRITAAPISALWA